MFFYFNHLYTICLDVLYSIQESRILVCYVNHRPPLEFPLSEAHVIYLIQKK